MLANTLGVQPCMRLLSLIWYFIGTNVLQLLKPWMIYTLLALVSFARHQL